MVKLQENINRIKSMMIQEQDTQMDDLFDKFINLTFPFMYNLKFNKSQYELENDNDLWMEDEEDVLMFTYFKSSNTIPNKIINSLFIVENKIAEQLEMMFGNQYKKLLANWFDKHYNLKIERIAGI